MLTKQTLNLWRRVFLFISRCLLDRSAARLEEMVAWLPISVAYCRIDRSGNNYFVASWRYFEKCLGSAILMNNVLIVGQLGVCADKMEWQRQESTQRRF